jgi:putative ABC transport system permease protein
MHRAWAVIESVSQDAGYAIRGLRRSPGLSLTILVTFALGFGANAALFSVVDRLFFQSPPGVFDPGGVRRLVEHARSFDGSDYSAAAFTTLDHSELAKTGIGEIEGYDLETRRDFGDGKHNGVVAYATAGFFRLTGVHPLRGRLFSTDENVYGVPVNVAVVSHGYWTRALGANPDVIGTSIRIDSSRYTVVGVALPRFDGLDVDAVDVWAPLASRPPTTEGPWWNGDFGIMELFARLPHGVDERSATPAYTVALQRAHVKDFRPDPTRRIELAPLLQARTAVGLGSQAERNLALTVRLAGVALLVLIIAMSNVASLLLMRALKRRREIAIRIALGISRRRLMGQVVIESLVLALLGAGFAILIALWTSMPLRAALLSNVRWTTSVVDARLVAFTLLLGIVVGCTAGLVPAIVGFRDDVLDALKAGSSESGRPRSAVRVTLLVTQTALCMLMLTASGMFIQTLRRARDFDLGFDGDRLITAFASDVPRGLRGELAARIAALPSVVAVGGSDADLDGIGETAPLVLSNGDSLSTARRPYVTSLDTGYARATGMRLLAGRTFTSLDRRGGEPVVVINQALADAFWRGRSPIGDCVTSMLVGKTCARIVGVVSNARWYITQPARPTLYIASEQSRFGCCSVLQVRTRATATRATVDAIRQIFTEISPNGVQPTTVRLVSDRLEPQIRPFRVAAGLFLFFGLLALTAASAGIYGLVAYDVGQRTREFGVRVALGATSKAILRLVLGGGARVVGLGLAAGIVASLALGRIMASLLFETSPYDPRILILTGIVLSAAAVLASLVPALGAARVDPVVALRSD